MAGSFTIDLAPRTALITGGSRGIGRATAELLARAGARVALNYLRDEAAVNAAVREIRAAGGEAMALAGDVGDAERRGSSCATSSRRGAGWTSSSTTPASGRRTSPAAATSTVWDRTYAVNLRGAFLVTDAAVPHLERARRRDRLRLVDRGPARRGAALGVRRVEGRAHLVHEVARRGARARAASASTASRPGWVDTDMTAAAFSQPADARPRSRGRSRSAASPRPADIAGPILFLVSDLARHVQGEVVNVNGGSVLVG